MIGVRLLRALPDDDDDDDDGGNYGAIAVAEEERKKGLENMAVANDTPDRDPLRL